MLNRHPLLLTILFAAGTSAHGGLANRTLPSGHSSGQGADVAHSRHLAREKESKSKTPPTKEK